MAVAEQRHPPEAQLLAFAEGKLVEPEFSAVENHLLSCDSCCEKMSRQPENTLLALAREVATVGFLAAHPGTEPTEIPAALLNHPRYRVVEQIGIGGMGAVYRAEHRMMQRMVALKIIHPRLVSHPEAAERFQRELRVAAKLAHPNIVVSYDADHADSLHFLVMEYVAGESLDCRIAREGPAKIVDACDWIRQAALGLHHAFEQGMAHRDIKPHNLMLTAEGQIKILDFGLSKVVSEGGLTKDGTGPISANASATQAATILGTPDYIAPEQIANSRAADIRSDIYSLGCTFFYLLTGKPPFATGTVSSRLEAHANQPFPRLTNFRSDAPPSLAAILGRMTAKSPADRYANPGEVADDLAQLIAELDPALAKRTNSAHPPRKSSADPIWLSPYGLTGMGTVAVLLVVLAAWAAGWLTGSPSRMLVLMPNQGLWYPDYQGLVDAAARERVHLDFASVSLDQSQLLNNSPQGVAVPDLKVDSKLSAQDYQAIIVIGYNTNDFQPGGTAGDETRRLLNEFQRQKKVVASLCAGQRVLAQQGVLRGKKVALCEVVRPEEIQIEGGTPVSAAVQVDGRVVTSSHAKFSLDFLREVKKLSQP